MIFTVIGAFAPWKSSGTVENTKRYVRRRIKIVQRKCDDHIVEEVCVECRHYHAIANS